MTSSFVAMYQIVYLNVVYILYTIFPTLFVCALLILIFYFLTRRGINGNK